MEGVKGKRCAMRGRGRWGVMTMGGGRRLRRGRRSGNGGCIGVEEVVGFFLKGERLGGDSSENMGPEG